MKYVLVLLALLYSTKAYADDCYKADKLFPALYQSGFLPVAEMEVEKHPAIILVNPDGIWIAFVMMDDNTVCEMAHGRAFHLVVWRKA